MRESIRVLRYILESFVIVLVVSLANISTSQEMTMVSNQASNRVINLTTMAMKLESDIKNDLYSAKDTYTGDLTGYGADCPLCGGHLGCTGQDVRDGTTTYLDPTYGNVRIVASSSSLACGSIVRFQLDKLSSEPIIAIVLDRGVLGQDLDLLMSSEAEARSKVGRTTLSYDVLRFGWARD